MDVRTGEVLAMASRPSYDLNVSRLRLTVAAAADIEERKAWPNNALNGVYSPGSTFKICVSTAALLSGSITPEDEPADCDGYMMVGNRRFSCDNGLGHHGVLKLPEAIAHSCDIFFYTVGLRTSAEVIAAQARKFHLDRPTGIELPGETHRMLIPDPDMEAAQARRELDPRGHSQHVDRPGRRSGDTDSDGLLRRLVRRASPGKADAPP